jgi:hypothetical protein
VLVSANQMSCGIERAHRSSPRIPLPGTLVPGAASPARRGPLEKRQ